MDKVSRINVEGRDYEVLSGGAVRGASASLADDWTKTVVLPQGAEPLDGIFLVVTFVYGNSVGTSKPQTVYSADGETFYADEGLTVPVTLPDPQNYSVTLVSGEEYSLQTYPVLNVNNTIFPVCNAKGYLCGGDKLWSPGDKVVILISDGYAQIMSAGISGSGITVYESLDDILEDLPNMSVGDVVATYDKKDIKTGVPLGTWASFANDSAPNGEWLQAGTTFNENTYPALAMMLGNNVVPEMFDHSRLGAFEDFAISTNASNPTVIEYDGFIYVRKGATNSEVSIFLNGVSVLSGITDRFNEVIPVKKGDTAYAIYFETTFLKVRYYKHPMFIKATPTSSDSDYEGTLNGIRGHISNTVSYSTEEKWTGGYWIDGKKIYRKCTQFYKNGQLYGGCSITNDQLSGVLPSDYDTIINYNMVNLGIDNSSTKFWDKIVGSRQYNKRINIYEINNVKATTVYINTGYNIYNGWFTIEYTKTTED